MDIELYEGQIATVYITLEGETDVYKVYGGTSKGQFHVECDDDMHWFLDVPAELTVGCSIPRYDIFAKRVSTGHEWRILSGKITTLKRQSKADGECISPREYHVTVKVVEGVEEVTGSSIAIGLRGEKGEKGDKGDKGDPGDGNVTAEAIQKVVPIAWGEYTTAPLSTQNGIAIGSGSKGVSSSVGIGYNAITYNNNVALGTYAKASNFHSISIGCNSTTSTLGSITIGYKAENTKNMLGVTIGATFDDSSGFYTCTTEGTGSITIGAGANTLNNGDTESSNSVTIGCKALNQGADSVVIGASASGSGAGGIVIGAGASANKGQGVTIGRNAKGSSGIVIGDGAEDTYKNERNIAIGQRAKATSISATAIGWQAQAAQGGTAIGNQSVAAGTESTAIGNKATVSDRGAVVIRSTAEDSTYTQLYFSGANTPLANTYHDGAPMLGYVTKDSAGNIVAAGTRSLIDLLTDNSTFAPASLDENGEWVQPKVFHPSDLDLPPQEEPTEPEEYQPLPVYPIVEPEMEEIE